MSSAIKQVELLTEYDIVQARQCARRMARELGFDPTDQTRIVTAVSEVARLALHNQAAFFFSVVASGSRRGLECICICEWPDMVVDRLDTSHETPEALEGVQRLMDDLKLEPREDNATAIVMHKWLR